MNTRHAANDDLPFSYPVKVGHISANPVRIGLEADAEELKALAKFWDVLSVDYLKAELQVSRWKKDGVKIKGEVHAAVTQSCVVTLEPVSSRIEETLEQIFVPEGSKLARMTTNEEGEIVLDPDGPDIPDQFTGDSIDAGAVVAEFAALAIDPYPRKSDVEFVDTGDKEPEEEKRPSPFAALKDWKKD
ncbi:YceD family protein [Agrobacterium sp. NPDC089420]|uniref:YceD family protein n=1 Tax=Agrobacterium sp. NPDC089420 TaxID=3363918 RepID=UPI0038516E74